jgi:hypothetical protein
MDRTDPKAFPGRKADRWPRMSTVVNRELSVLP